MPEATFDDRRDRGFAPGSRWFAAVLLLVVVLATLLRLHEIHAPGHLVEREYNSAIFARAFYFEGNDAIEPWRQENAIATRDRYPMLEPPVTELLLSLIYRAAGREELAYGRYLTCAFWLIGALLLYRLVARRTAPDVALFAVAYYLLAPWSVIVSRSVQPDALMMMMFLASLLAMVRHFEAPTPRSLLVTAALTSITLLLRPLVVFALVAAFGALSIRQRRSWRGALHPDFLVFVLVSAVLPAAYYGYGILVAGSLHDQASLSFRPHLLVRAEFWRRWFEMVAEVGGHAVVFAAVLGFGLLRSSLVRTLVLGLLAGYFVFGLVFTYHTITHPYYHIQLLPVLGWCAAMAWVRIVAALREVAPKWWWAPVGAALVFAVYFAAQDVRASVRQGHPEDRGLAREIGELVGHSPRVVFVARHYGMPLEYHGEFTGAAWPVRIDDPFYRPPGERERTVQERLDGLGFVPDYFVVTDFDLLGRKHADLQAYLEAQCKVHARTDRYVIYRPGGPQAPVRAES